MKKLFLIAMVFYSQGLWAQSTETGTIGLPDDIACPPGLCEHTSVSIQTFNFHKPRTNCTSGFGLCIRLGFTTSCGYCNDRSVIKGDKVKVWANLSGKKAEIHLPVALQSARGFEKTDMSTFEVEEKTISFTSKDGVERWVKGGSYPVAKNGDEFIVVLNLY